MLCSNDCRLRGKLRLGSLQGDLSPIGSHSSLILTLHSDRGCHSWFTDELRRPPPTPPPLVGPGFQPWSSVLTAGWPQGRTRRGLM